MNHMLVKVVVALAGAVLAYQLAEAQTAPSADTYTFACQRRVGTIDRIESALDVGGDLKVADNTKVKRLKMSVLANLTYDERTLAVPKDRKDSKAVWRAARYYDKAAAKLQIDSDTPNTVLRDDRKLIGAVIEGPKATLFSPRGPLTREELDLVEILGNSLLMDGLLPDQPVKLGQSWSLSSDLVTAILGLDAISQSDVTSTLLTVTDDRARFEMGGKVSGAIDGVATEVELKAKYHLDRKAGRICWFGLLVRENRSIGHVGPGLEVTARLQMKITPAVESAQLSDAALASQKFEATPESTQLAYDSPQGGWQFLHDRRWFVTRDDANLADLRLLDRGDLMAQCKVSSLPNAPAGKETTLAAFQEDIKHGLGKNFKQFLEAGQSANQADYRVFRVLVEGSASDLPIRWIYYLLADKHGHQVVFAFVLESRLMEAFGKADERLLSTVRLSDPKVASKPAEKQ
jgi:hypothetical protein